MLKKLLFISLLFAGTSCAQLTSLIGNDAARTALTTTGDYVIKEKLGKHRPNMRSPRQLTRTALLKIAL